VTDRPTVPVYNRSTPESVRAVDRFADGVTWIAHPDEDGRRASHALRAPDGVWLFDPLDGPGVEELLADLLARDGPGPNEVAGVAVCSSYHARDAGRVAARHDVAVHVPVWMDRVPERVEAAPIERVEGEGQLADSGFRLRRCEPFPGWQEAFAYRQGDGTLYVPDSLGTTPLHTVGDERLGVTLVRRPQPPRALLGDLTPERVLVGHGSGVHDRASEALADALAGARRRLPRGLLASLGTQVRALVAATR
jgi:hypothetical protein